MKVSGISEAITPDWPGLGNEFLLLREDKARHRPRRGPHVVLAALWPACSVRPPMRFLRAILLCLAALTGGCSRAPEAKTVKPGMALAEADRVYIAEVEARALVLNRRGFPALTAAVQAGDAPKVAGFFATDFTGAVLEGGESADVKLETLALHRRTSADEGVKPAAVPADAFAAALVALRRKFDAETAVEMALTSLLPAQADKLDGAWSAGGALRMAGKTSDGRTGELLVKLDLDLASVPDADAIGQGGGWIRGARLVEEQMAVAAAPLMAEIGGERGVNRWALHDNWHAPAARREIQSGGVFVADMNDDGEQDMLVTDINGPVLYLGAGGGKFTDATKDSGIPAALKGIGAVAIADFDNDGHVDIILPRHILRGDGTGKFADITARMKFNFGRLTGFSVADYDRDGRLDLYVSRFNGIEKSAVEKTSWIDGPGGPGNQLWRNLGDWKFEDVSDKANARAGQRSVFTSIWLDVNDDAWPDVYVINEFGGGILLVNNGDGTFREQHLLDDAGDFGSMGMAAADYDNDGRVDIYTANMYSKAGRRIMENLPDGSFEKDVFAKMKRFVTGSELYHNDGGLKFTRAGKAARVHAVGWAYGAAFVDMDGDGFLDLYGTAGFMSVNKEEPDG